MELKFHNMTKQTYFYQLIKINCIFPLVKCMEKCIAKMEKNISNYVMPVSIGQNKDFFAFNQGKLVFLFIF